MRKLSPLGEIMLRIAVLRKEMGLVDLSMQMCNSITSEPYSDVIRANALCLKVFDACNNFRLFIFKLCCPCRAYCMKSGLNFLHPRLFIDLP